MSREIKLSRGKVTLVDDTDYEWLSQWRWCLCCGYAARSVGTRINRQRIYMHRLIMNNSLDGEVDHIDRNRLNNQRYNLRAVNRGQNMQNKPTRSKSGFRGVSPHGDVWEVAITVSGKYIWLGRFRDKVVGARAYDAAAREYYGEHAYLNFPDET